MPIYEYKCPVCGNEEERLVKVEERDEQRCNRPYSLEETRDLAERIGKMTPEQSKFFAAPDDEVLYGGAVGGGMSDALPVDNLRLVRAAIGDACCAGKMRREEISVTAKMADQWRS